MELVGVFCKRSPDFLQLQSPFELAKRTPFREKVFRGTTLDEADGHFFRSKIVSQDKSQLFGELADLRGAASPCSMKLMLLKFGNHFTCIAPCLFYRHILTD